MEKVRVEGYVEKIVYHNDENGYTVLTLSNSEDGEEICCVGTFSYISEGQYYIINGHEVIHKEYGPQISVDDYEEKQPENAAAIEKYLGSGAIKGIGVALAARIVRKFGDKTFEIIDREPESLSKIKGISEKKARDIAEQFYEKRQLRKAMVYLQQYGIQMALSVKIYKQYGEKMYEILEKNPYKLAEDINGVGFKKADAIAQKLGFSQNSEYRIRAGIYFALNQAGSNGHCYLPQKELVAYASNILMIEETDIEPVLSDMVIEKAIIITGEDDDRRIYSSNMYYMELNIARMLKDLNIQFKINDKELESTIKKAEKAIGITLDEVQKKAICEAVKNGVMIITGGPGTGKTTIINTILYVLEDMGLEVLMAAPTGRAAKRMTETTEHDSQTIHRLLENSANPDDKESSVMKFARNEENPLETDAVIVDEMSMVDVYLLNAMLRSIVPGTRLIMVGDSSQLPSVGPGNVLNDMINAHFCNVVKLTKIFRQAAQSDIILNAHKVNSGEHIDFNNKSEDFFLLERDDSVKVMNVMIQLVMQKLPSYVDADVYDIQVLTPMRKGELGVENLNQVLQKYLNPSSPQKNEKEFHGVVFRENDKIMQIKNNYQAEWKRYNKYNDIIEEGKGVYNGDCGIIESIDTINDIVTICYEEGKKICYDFNEMDEIMQAFAITVHKAQGSEYPAVVMPVLSGPKMLFNRNLLYTAMTRAKKCVIFVGSSKMINTMIDNIQEQERYSSLAERINEV